MLRSETSERPATKVFCENPLSLLQQRSSTRLESTSPSADVALRFFLECDRILSLEITYEPVGGDFDCAKNASLRECKNPFSKAEAVV